MSTKQTTDSSNTLQYDPGAKSIYDQLTKGGSNVLSGYMNNPFSNPFYTLGLGQSQRGAAQQGQNSINAMLSNMRTSGLNGQAGAGFQQAQMNKIGRSNMGMMSQANMGNIFQALNRQLQATGMGMSFNPLLTGEKGQTTQQTSGLGTWLPQLLGAAGGAAMAGLTGGASMAAGGMPSTKGLSMASMPSSTAMNPFLGNINAVAPQSSSMPAMPFGNLFN